MGKKANRIVRWGRIAWLYTKYQLITKGLVAIVILPIASTIMQHLLKSTGRVNISSGDYLGFLFSFQGVGMLVLGLVLLIILIGMDINAFIIMSALVYEDRIQLSAKHLLMVGLRSLKSFLKPSGILIVIYMALVIPLVGVGVTISPMRNFQIPNFITDVIFKNPLYSSLYFLLLLLLTFITIRYAFFFHYVLLLKEPIADALKKASRLMKKHWKCFIRDFVLWSIFWALAASVALAVIIVLFMISANIYSESETFQRIWAILGLLFISEGIAYVTLMTVPIICYRLTELFYRYHAKDKTPLRFNLDVNAETLGEDAFGKVRIRTKLAIAAAFSVLLLSNALIATLYGTFFDDLFRVNRSIDIIAHRGGGDLAAENTVSSLEAVIRENVAWSEIDVQRTKDGRYIINHDPTFSRVAGESRSSSEMTLEEIKQLRVKDLFDTSRAPQEVATMEEMLDAAKNRIGLFIELKGSTADEKMADDVIAMVKERNMMDEIAILSLDYQLITYVEEKYPEIQTGFLYFFSIGDTAKMNGDILIMEEREATPEKIDEIHAAGKKAIVWTVNTEESINKFVKSEVDGIITDYVMRVKEGIMRRDNRSDFDILIDNFLG